MRYSNDRFRTAFASLFCSVVVCAGFIGSTLPLTAGDLETTTRTDEPSSIPVEVVVDSRGHDGGAGTREEPFATLEQARDAVRDIRSTTGVPAGGLTITLRGGDYRLTEPLVLTADDSGKPGSPIRWRAESGETVSVHGAEVLDPAWFAPLDPGDPIRDAFVDPAAADAVLAVDLPSHGITDYGTLERRGYSAEGAVAALELFVGGEPMELARWPNRGQNDFFDPTGNADARGDVFGDGTIFAYIGTAAVGNADDGYPNYHADLGGGEHAYLYHCTWGDGNRHTYWFISPYDPTTDSNCWPTDQRAWWGHGTNIIPLMEPLSGAAQGDVIVHDKPPGTAESGFVFTPDAIEVGGETLFTFPGDRHTAWTVADDLWFQGLFGNFWADDTLPGVIDTENRVQLGGEPSYGIDPRQPFAVVNVLEEIDSPGEWFLDRTTGRLFLWPPGPLDDAEILVSMNETPLLELNGAQHLRFEDLTYEAARGRLVTAVDVDDVVFERCTFRNSGAAAVEISGVASGLERCTVADAGGRAVRIEGGHRPTLTPAANFVRNSDIHGFGRWERTYREGVRLYGCGNIIEHNHIHDAPHAAIIFFGNEHVIQYNDIERVVLEANDAGAIYAGRDWGYRGTEIRFNFFHDIDSVFGGSHGVYLDDAVSGMEVFGNIFYGVSGLATMSGGGRDNHFANNVIVGCEGGHSTDRRARTSNYSFGYLDRPDSWNLLGRVNVVFETYYSDHPDVQTIAYQSPPWSTAYPTLAAMPNDWGQVESSHWQDPEGCEFSSNITWQADPMLREGTWGGAGALGFYTVEQNIEEQDPLFVGVAGGDFNLRPDSPAFTIPGFVAIPFDEIGIEGDPAEIFADGFESGDADRWSATTP